MESRVIVVIDEYSDHHHQQQQQHLSMAMPMNINISVGFQFVPTDIELIECYLKKRMMSASSSASLPEADDLIVDFDIYSRNPWELPRHLFRYPSQQREMYFFSPTHPLSTTSSRSSGKRCGRTTGCGVWHGNGQDNRIIKNGVVIEHTTTFKFEMIDQPVAGAGAEEMIKGSNKRCNGNDRRKTDWLMHEYRLPSTNTIVICKIYENKTRAAAAASSPSTKQQEHQQHHPLNTKRRQTVEEEEEPVSVRPSMPMPSLVSMAYSNAPALDHIVQVSKLVQQQQLLLNPKRRRLIGEEEPVPVPLAVVLPSSSEITLMASAPAPVSVPTKQQQQQQQQVEDADADFALSLERLLEEEKAVRHMPCGVAAAVLVPVVMPDEATFLSSLQNMPELPSLQQKGCGSTPLPSISTLIADKEFSADVNVAAVGFEQEATESDKRHLPLLKRKHVDETAIEELQQQQQQQEQGQMNTPDSTKAVSRTNEDEDIESLLKKLSFGNELGSLPPIDLLFLQGELSMTPDDFFAGVEDYPF